MMDAKNHNTDELLSAARTAAEGERAAAISALLDRYRGYLSVLAKVYIDQRVQAKLDDSDLVQETLLEAHRGFEQFRGSTEGEFIAWLRAILAHQGARHMRHLYGTRQRDPRLERAVQQNLEDSTMTLAGIFADERSSPSQQAVQRERAVALADAIEMLPPHYREVMILHHLEGLTMPQVAEQMDRTVDSVQKIWARALIGLRKNLSDME